jgi:iron complex transport system substrate-binding protein
VALWCVLTVGCGRTDKAPVTNNIVVPDDAGDTVALAQPAQRIVSLMPSVTDLLLGMGAGQRLIARTDYDRDARIVSLPSVGGGLTPSVEWLAAQKPQLVISWPDNASRSLAARIRSIGIPVYTARTETIADALRTVQNLGVLLNATSSADSLIKYINTGLDSVRGAVAARRRVTVAYLLSADPPMAAGPGNFVNELIAAAGGQNIFGDAQQTWPQVSTEELVKRNPDVIVLARDDTTRAYASVARLPGWSNIRAVQQMHVFAVSADLFNRSGPTMPYAAAHLADLFKAAQ